MVDEQMFQEVLEAIKNGQHARHDIYNFYIENQMNTIFESIKKQGGTIEMQMKFFNTKIKNLVRDTKVDIAEKSIKKGKKINQLFE